MSPAHDPRVTVDWYRTAKGGIDQVGLGLYFARECRELGPLISAVYKHLPQGSRLLEFGTGPGVLAIYLSRRRYQLVGIDANPEIVTFAVENNQRLDGAAQFQVCDPSALNKTFGRDSFDAVLSYAALEHLTDEQVLEALRQQLITAKLNIFGVHCSNLLPKYRNSLYGDERLLRPSYWEHAIRKAGGAVIDRFGYGFNVTRLGQLNWRIPPIAEGILFRRLARFASVTGFVVTRCEL